VILLLEPEDKFRNYLKKKGLKFTPEREVILKEIFSLHKHFDVDELYLRVHRKNRRLSRATIYRTLPLLVESGLIVETFRCLGRSSYEHIFGHPHHDHMICIKCGKVIEFSSEKIKRLQEEICKKYGFKSVEYRLGIKGYCKKCAARK
jgi:Fur family ferric uptake transcriptional regulator